MIKLNLLVICLLFHSLGGIANTKSSVETFKRIKENINREWRFILDDPKDNPMATDYNDSSWDRIGLPHSFSIPYFRSEKFYVGYGWYRKNLKIEKEWISKNIELEFDGVFQVAEVYLNGEKVGEHQGGYTGFTINISHKVKEGNNCLAIRVNNIWNPKLAPRAGEHVFSGGIYRDVYLTITDPLHVSWNGTFVSTPSVSAKEAIVNVKTEVKNNGTGIKHCTLKTIICDNLNREISVMKSIREIKAGELFVFDQTSDPIRNPKLWSPDSPYLYRVKTIVYDGNREVDNYLTPLGIRWFEWTSDKGFFLNGKHLFLEGANVHQDHAGWGDAVTQAGVYRDVKLMKEAGFNLIRGSHYPHHPQFAKACDELGMIFLPENCVWGIGGFKEDGDWLSSAYPIYNKDQAPYEESAKNSLDELIRINRNSPSVVAWSMSNEPFMTADSVVPHMKKMLSRLVDYSHQLDPTRPALIGGAQRREIDILGDIAGYNGDGAALYRNPGFPNLVSEYGSCVADRPGDYIPCWDRVENGEKPEWRSGHAIWCGFDHGSIAGKMGKMGIVDFYRIPKRSWYWYRNYFKGVAPPEWPEEGKTIGLKVFADKTTLKGTDGTDDAHINVQVINDKGKHISNSPDVTLTIVSGPGEFPTGRRITFKNTTKNDIQILDGHAAIEFRSYEGGVTVIEANSKGLKPAQIEITTIGEPIYQEGITPIVNERPYQDYALIGVSKKDKIINVSDNRPTRTNSVSKSNPSLANDGNLTTTWMPIKKNKSLWWLLDMENFYMVTKVDIDFQKSNECDVVVYVSDDQKDWVEVAMKKVSNLEYATTEINIDRMKKGRFLKIDFSTIGNNKDIEVREISVSGI